MIKIDASSYQKNFYLEWKLDPDSIKYNLSLLFEIRGFLNIELLEKSILQFINFGQNQRTFFIEEENTLKQIVIDTINNFELEFYDLSQLEGTKQKNAIKKLLSSVHQHRFDLKTLALYRYALIKRADNEYLFTAVWHHIVADGAFLDNFVGFISKAYNALIANKALRAPKLDDIKEYIEYEKKHYSQKEKMQDLRFWEKELASTELHINLPKLNFSQAESTHQLFSLDRELSQKIITVVRQNNTTLFIFLMAAFSLLIEKYTAQKECVLSYPVNLKPKKISLPGCFVNMALIKLRINSDHTIKEFIEYVRRQRAISKGHQTIPLFDIVSHLRRSNSYEENAFNVSIAETTLGLLPLKLENCECYSYPRELQHIEDLGCHFQYLEKIYLKFDHNSKYFDSESIQGLFESFKLILEQFVECPDRQLKNIQILREQQRLQILDEWSGRRKEYPQNKTIHQLFEEQVLKNPQSIAIHYDKQVFSYAEVNQKANQLANLICSFYQKNQQDALHADCLIGLCVNRSLNMIIGILGILKAGAAYVPIDPEYPEERLKYILDDCQPILIITEGEVVAKHRFIPKSYLNKLLILDDHNIEKQLADCSCANLKKMSCPESLAYVIYTSGSTGKPKGVLVEQRAVVNYIANQADYLKLKQPKSFYFIHSFAFDTSISSIFGSLLSGGRLILVKENQRLNELNLLNYEIDVAYLPPAFLAAIKPENLAHIGTIIVSGESSNSNVLSKIKADIINEYGPTECTVCTTYTKINKQDKNLNINLVGKGLFNTKIYILDENFNPCPVGVPGELYIGGIGVARGYLNQKALTQERFIANPFSNNAESSRLYKTGDVMRWLPDGNVEYIGRTDFQVKIRGYRVELGEIENVLEQSNGIQQTAVIANEEEGQKYLVAYYVVATDQSPPRKEELRAYLRHHLPDYMIPALFIKLDKIPLTANGKLDRKALPKLERDMGSEAESHVVPRNELENQLAKIWSQILRIKRVGIYDNFFSLGGDSILSIQVVSCAREHQLYFTPKDLFQNPTIVELASLNLKGVNINAEQGQISGELPLTPIQHWFFAEKFEEQNYWNQAQLLMVNERLDLNLLQKSLDLVIQHHDALRLRYALIKKTKKYKQFYENTTSAEHFVVKSVDLSNIASKNRNLGLQNHANRLQSLLNITQGPILSAAAFTGFEDNRDRLFIAIHHLVVDGVSWRILIADLESCYQQLKSHRTATLPIKTSSYKDWGQALTNYAKNKAGHDLEYWKKVQQAIVPLKTDLPCKQNASSHLGYLKFSLSKLETYELINRSQSAYHTEINDLLISALAVTIQNWQKKDVISFNLEGHGREEVVSGVDVTRTVGWFTSLFPIVLELASTTTRGEEIDYKKYIQSIKEQLRHIPDKGLSYGVLRYLHPDLKIRRLLSKGHNPGLSFNYLGQFDGKDKKSSWRFTRELTAKGISQRNHSPDLLELNGLVVDGQLEFSLAFSLDHFQDETIKKFTADFKQNLLNIISHCIKQQKTYFTPSDFTTVKLSQRELDKLYGFNFTRIYALTPLQEGMLFHALHTKESDQYCVQVAWDYIGYLDVSALKMAWQSIIESYDVLRTQFIWHELREPVQIVVKEVKLPWNSEDFSGLSQKDQRAQLQAYQLSDRVAGFDLNTACLMRLHCIKLSDSRHRFILSHHHIIMDGWCMPIILDELAKRYKIIIQDLHLSMHVVPVYEQYIKWLKFQDNKLALDYWKQQLSDIDAATDLPVKKPKAVLDPNKPIVQLGTVTLQIEKQKTKEIINFVKDHSVTINSLFQLAWSNILSRYSGEKQVIYGSVSSGRSHSVAGIEKMVGLLINSLPIVLSFEKDKSITEYLQKIHQTVQEANHYSYSSLVDIQKQSKIPHGKPLFTSLFVFENYPKSNKADDEQLKIVDIKHFEKTNYPITITVFIKNDILEIKVDYDEDCFEQATVKRLLAHINNFINQALQNAGQAIGSVDILDWQEKQQILFDWNRTEKDYPEQSVIQQLFEEQVAKKPDNIAIIFKEKSTSYCELNKQVNRLAHLLREKYQNKNQAFSPDTLIGLCVERSLEMIIGILGILKAGGAYVPLDPDYPEERLEYVIADSRVKIILTQDNIVKRKSFLTNLAECELVLLDHLSAMTPAVESSVENPVLINRPKDLAYIIYTSGSTGNPKGVMIEHEGVINRIAWMNNAYGLTQQDRILQKTPFSFDVSVWELLWPMMYGGQLVFAEPEGHKNPAYLVKLIEKAKITKLHFVPSMLDLFVKYILSEKIDLTALNSLTDVFCSGEALPLGLQQLVNQKFSFKLHNLYGPTEASIDVSYFYCNDLSPMELNSVPIGKPIDNMRLYILDSELNLCPIGMPGELYIGGIGLARGYLNKELLSAERFISNPFALELNLPSSDRIYKTGDLVRWLADGNIEYIGRGDFQVKIHGFRIELGEIEHALAQFPDIQQTTVVAYKTESHQYLVAYYVSRNKNEISIDALRKFLAIRLPEPMIPTAFVKMDTMPLLTSGKINRKALPDIAFKADENRYVAPNTLIEEEICKSWQALLEIERIGIKDDFFYLGGNSLLAIRLVSLLNIKFKSQISVRDLYTHRTVESISRVIAKLSGEFEYQDYLIEDNKAISYEPFPLTNVQQAYLYGRLKIFEMGNVSTHGYMEILFDHLNVEKLQAALNLLIKRHPALRTLFASDQQFVLENQPLYAILNHYEVNEKQLSDIRNRLSHKIYNPQDFPLFDFEVSRFEKQFILHMSFDALIMDGTSMAIFFKEFAMLYNASQLSEAVLPLLTLSFKDYVEQYLKVRASKLFDRDKAYWVDKLPGYDFSAQLPMRMNPSLVKQPVFKRLTKTIPKFTWSKIQTKATQYQLGLTSIVLFAYGLVLSRWSGKSTFPINLTLFNRLPLNKNINDIMGDFTVLEIFNFHRQSNNPILDGIQQVHEALWNDIEHNLFDGIDFQRLVRKELQIGYDQSLSPVVLTSVLGGKDLDFAFKGYTGTGYSITQTSQVYLDNKAYLSSEGFIAEWDYVEQLFDESVICEMHETYCHLLEYLAEADWEECLPLFNLSTADQSLVDTANQATQPVVEDTIVDLCMASIAQHREKAAVIDAQGTYSYQRLDEDSEGIAQRLFQENSKFYGLTAVLCEKGYLQVASTLGILRAGGLYLPLNPDWPLGRIEEILQGGEVKQILVSALEYQQLVKGNALETCYDWLIIETILAEKASFKRVPLPPVELDDTAYVIFTSGSTGRPKGVEILHRNAVNTLLAVNAHFGVGSDDKVLALSELSFDLSVYDLFGVLAAGGTIVFPDAAKTKEPGHWCELISRHGITLWNTVPQLMGLLVDYAKESEQSLASLRVVLLSGDWIPLTLPAKIRAVNSQLKLSSLGGATEGSIWSIWYPITVVEPQWTSIPYGRAMPNQKMYVLNEWGEHCPPGVIGEIHIGGEGVALCYWRDPAKTAASFFNHPSLGRLYKTGDLGQWSREGTIEFSGRKDFQVKLNGYRIELEEITARLLEVRGLTDAVVTVQNEQVVAYWVAERLKSKPFDATAFKLEQKGLRRDVTPCYELKGLKLDEAAYRLRKSYRQFQQFGVTADKLESCLQLPLSPKVKRKEVSFALSTLEAILAPVSALLLKDKLLPKYRYPSGGSTYAIQCYVVVPEAIGGVAEGYYYYHPVHHYLADLGEIPSKHYSKTAQLSLEFQLYLPAIEPLYQAKSRGLAWLELGHLLSLLEESLDSLGLGRRLRLIDEQTGDYHHLVSIDLSPEETLDAFFDRQAKAWDYLPNQDAVFSKGRHRLDLKSQDVFEELSGNGQLLRQAGGLIAFRGNEEAYAWMQSGYWAEKLSEILYQHDIGSCALGFVPYEGANYCLALGTIEPLAKTEAESQATVVRLEDYLENYLQHYLPPYMLPRHYIQLGQLPLTAAGKLDVKALPKVEVSQEEYLSPSTELEKELCNLWQELLGVERIGIRDDFFRLGGNSILAIQFTHRVMQTFQIHIAVADIFQHKTITQLTKVIENANNIIIPVSTSEKPALSFAQQRLWFIEQYEQGTTAYHNPMLFELAADIDSAALQQALKAIVARHEVLRSVISQDTPGQFYQKVLAKELIIPIYHLENEMIYQEQLAEGINKIFDLTKEYPLRVCLYEINETDQRYLLINIHHIAFDGWSVDKLFSELSAYYRHYHKGQILDLPRLSIQYKDYAQWQRSYLQGEVLNKQIQYWTNKLKDYAPLQLPIDKARPKQIDYHGAEIPFVFSERLSQQLRDLARKQGCSLYAVILTGFYILLYKYTGQSDLVIGTPIANRQYAQVKDLIGFFANSLVLREKISTNADIGTFLNQIKNNLIETQRYQDLPFEQLVDLLAVDRDPGRHPIFQVLLRVQGFGQNQAGIFNREMRELEVGQNYINAQFDLSLLIDDSHASLSGIFNYALSLFEQETIARMAKHFEVILEAMVGDLSQKIAAISLLNSTEYQQIIRDWNKTEKQYASNKTLHQLFEEQVEKSPDNIAVVLDEQELTYQTLNQEANQLAHYLREKYQQLENRPLIADTLVGVYIERSFEMMIGILAILKAGGAYLPLDPDYPDDRIEYMIENSQLKLIITQQERVKKGSFLKQKHASKLLILDNPAIKKTLANFGKTNPKIINHPSDLAYIIYTSGSTGKPKGAMLEHQGIVNRITWMHNSYGLTSEDRILQKTPFSFDVSVWELFWPILYGAQLILAKPKGHKDPTYLAEVIKRNAITKLHFVPSMLQVFLEYLASQTEDFLTFNSLKDIFCSGEALSLSLQQQFKKQLSANIHNLYGPTEASIDVTYYNCANIPSINNLISVPIGKPIDNMKLYILDCDLNPCPIGVTGELYIGGVGLARGYLNQDTLTKERFIEAPPFANVSGERIYKTGDAVRWLSDGNIEYIGRMDFQVKIRGFRIELGEIENALEKFENIQQSVVIVLENKEHHKYLAAYYVVDKKTSPPAVDEIKKHLEKLLPEYMVPASFMQLDAMPLSANGKVDRKALPEIEFTSHDYIPPENDLEIKVCSIFAEVLGLTSMQVGLRDDFFRFGGDSILAIRLVAKINESLDSHLAVKDIFILKTVGKIAAEVNKNISNFSKENEYKKLSLANPALIKTLVLDQIDDVYPASYLQSGMLLESSLHSDGTYHDVFAYTINHTFNQLRFLAIWNQLTAKHALLRCKFVLFDNGWNLIVVKEKPLLDCRIEKAGDLTQIIQDERKRDFDFNEPGLFKLIINDFGEHFDFIFSFHHAITDGWSIASIINEFIQAYVFAKEINLDFELSYGEFIRNERKVLEDKDQINFWKSYLSEFSPVKAKWKFKTTQSISSMFRTTHSLEKKYVKKLKVLAYDQSISIDSIFLCAYLLTISQLTNEEDITIGLVVNNRLEKKDGDKLFGLFLNTIPLRFKVNDSLNANRVFQEKVKLYHYKHMPYGLIKSLIGIDVYEFAFNFVHFHALKASVGEMTNTNGFEKTNIPFMLDVIQTDNELFILSLAVHDNYIDEDYLDYFKKYLIFNLKQILDNNYKRQLTQDDQDKVLNRWNSKQRPYSPNETLAQLFENQVEKNPNAIAVVFEKQSVTYRELNEKANQLARLLQQTYPNNSRTTSGNLLIGLCLKRSLNAIISILGILKAGAAYVPLDPDYPKERLNYMINDSRAEIIITEQKVYENASFLQELPAVKLLVIDDHRVCIQLKGLGTDNRGILNKSSDLAYIIYTSGSTGKPKGVMLEHRSVINYIKNIQTKCLAGHKNVDFSSSLSFDLTVTVTLAPLLMGNTIYVYPNRIEDIDSYVNYLHDNNIQFIKTVPALYELVAQKLPANTQLREVVLGGEKLNRDKITAHEQVRVYDEYGPTETAVGALFSVIHPDNQPGIGKPYDNYQLYILDKDLQLVPIGVVGELYIGGAGLARGYLNNQTISNERFITNLYNQSTDNDSARIYKTGDLVRWLPDGNVEYIGRSDFQVKIRGFRIELGEIEAALSGHPSIKKAVVISFEENRLKYLLAYYVLAQDKPDPGIELRSFLSKTLPEYMIPTAFIKLEEIPLTENGKINRNGLPKFSFEGDSERYVAPRNATEKLISSLWQEFLNIEQISIQDDFFRIGGDSILSIQLASKMNGAGLACKVIDIFKYPTIEKLSQYLTESVETSVTIDAEQGILAGKFDLLPIQKWFFEQDFANINYWNQSFLINIPEIAEKKLKSIIASLVKQHDILRVIFSQKKNGNFYQRYSKKMTSPTIKTLDLSHFDLAGRDKKVSEILTEWQSDFNIEKGPLWQVGYLYGYPDGSARLFFALHHLIIDTVSWRILIEDIKNLYAGNKLAPKTSSYRQWVHAVQDYAEKNSAEIPYWLSQNQGSYVCKISQKSDSEFLFGKIESKQLLQQANKAYHTEINDLLLTALAYLLAEWQVNKRNAITLEGHGREFIKNNIDVSHTVGWFTTTYPVRLEIRNSLSDTIMYIKECLRSVPKKGIGYGALRYSGRQELTSSLPPVSFNYLGQFDSSEDRWRLAQEDSGISRPSENKESNIINIIGFVINNELRFTLETQLGDKLAYHLAQRFKHHLLEIINHCLSINKNRLAQYTFSDFEDFIPYIQINNTNNLAKPIFFFPPGSGNAESYYNNLVPHFTDMNLILFNNFYWYLFNSIGREAAVHYSIEKLAIQYIALIKRLQPEGPYDFVGWSFGGVLATEIARQLSVNGDKINHIFIINSHYNFRQAVNTLYQSADAAKKIFSNNINYHYVNSFELKAKMVLFKSLGVDEKSEVLKILNETEANKFLAVAQYYAHTDDNHIKEFIKCKDIKILSLTAGHLGWTGSKADINFIAKIIRDSLAKKPVKIKKYSKGF